MAKRQAAGAPVLRPPYGDMVTRTHELCLALIGQAQAGNENGVKTMAEQLMAQVGALVSLMNLKGEKND
ncbi:MAG: hypothetical protein IKA55_07175 [Akkermansia sp.]|nr:hypothetical protein [Akkermansia sp.]